MAHHLAAGFDRMLVLSHDCTDGSDALLDALAQDDRIVHLPFVPKGGKSVQWQALRHLRDTDIYTTAEWALFFDCDEFICAPHDTLRQTLLNFEKTSGAFDALALPWRLYGSGGQKRRTAGLTPERFTRAAPFDLHFPLAHLFKTLHRPAAFRQPGVHRPRARPRKPARWLGPDGARQNDGFSRNDAAITLYGATAGSPRLWLNHYSLRSVEEFMVKRARGLPNHMDREIGLSYWAERNWNNEEAGEILPMLEATHAEVVRLMSLPNVETAHRACLKAHDSRYQALSEDVEALRLAFRLGFLTGSTPPSAEDGRAFIAAQMRLARGGAAP
ncbi:glycosyltransferase family 2 protein [uncultured Roseovarius sp.]|uniref:glycosyltransferase family 2 protein n=1 Tax=uncultured Roseovarius sp. TaxID=293344 RepID=UPI0026394870|nr:glycosyltransferase family 2 protein [uncultured Roseovarius sp.]